MKTFVSTNVYQNLNLDARVKSDKARVKLNIVDKKDPDTWYTTYKNSKVDNFVTFLRHEGGKLNASLLFSIKSDEDLCFAKSNSVSCDQVFDGVLFAAGNEHMKKLRAVESELIDETSLRLTIHPSEFWSNEHKSQNIHYAGKKIGFRFAIQDKENGLFFSHDPMVIVPDWEPN